MGHCAACPGRRPAGNRPRGLRQTVVDLLGTAPQDRWWYLETTRPHPSCAGLAHIGFPNLASTKAAEHTEYPASIKRTLLHTWRTMCVSAASAASRSCLRLTVRAAVCPGSASRCVCGHRKWNGDICSGKHWNKVNAGLIRRWTVTGHICSMPSREPLT